MELACGQCGMSLQDFYRATPRETFNVMRGRMKQRDVETRARELEIRTSWEQTRWQTWWLVNMQLQKHKRIRLQEMARFPWEEQTPKEYISAQALKQFLN